MILKYAVKSSAGLDTERPKAIENEAPLPDPPRPGDIDCIISGFPWYVQSHAIEPTVLIMCVVNLIPSLISSIEKTTENLI